MNTVLSCGTYTTSAVFSGRVTVTVPILPFALVCPFLTVMIALCLGLLVFTTTLCLNVTFTSVNSVIGNVNPSVTGGMGGKWIITALQIGPVKPVAVPLHTQLNPIQYPPLRQGLGEHGLLSEMKALKCKPLGGIHMQSTATMHTYTSVVYILRMRVRVPRCPE